MTCSGTGTSWSSTTSRSRWARGGTPSRARSSCTSSARRGSLTSTRSACGGSRTTRPGCPARSTRPNPVPSTCGSAPRPAPSLSPRCARAPPPRSAAPLHERPGSRGHVPRRGWCLHRVHRRRPVARLDRVRHGSGGLPGLYGIPHRFCGVGAARRGGPLVVARPRLSHGPAGGLLYFVVATAAAAAVAAAYPAALVVRHRMLEIAAPGSADAGGLGALPVPHLDQVAEQSARPVPGRLIPVITLSHRDRDELDDVIASADLQLPVAISAFGRLPVIISGGEGESGAVAIPVRAGLRDAAAVSGGS